MELQVSSILPLLIFLFVIYCNAQQGFFLPEPYPDLKSLDLFKDHPMDIGSLLPDSLMANSAIPSSLESARNKTISATVNEPSDVVSLSARNPSKQKSVFSIRNAEVVKHPPPVTYNTTIQDLPLTTDIVTTDKVTTTQKPTTVVIKPKVKKNKSKSDQKQLVTDLDITGRVVHEFLPKNMWNDIKTPTDDLSNTFKDSFNIAESSVLLSDVFKQPWNNQQLIRGSYSLPADPFSSKSNRILNKKDRFRLRRKKQQILRHQQQQQQQQQPPINNPSIEQLTNLLKRENTLLNIALGLISKDKSHLKDTFLHRKTRCPYKEYSGDKRYFMEKVKDAGWIKRRCALGTAYDQQTCECSINIGYQPEGCKPEVFMNFDKGVVADQSENQIPCGVEGVVSLSDLAYFNGASRIVFWRYMNFDFQKAITLKFRFKSEATTRKLPHPLITNCGTGNEEPSFGVILNSFSDVLTFFVKTTKSDIKFVTFKVNPTEWNEVIYSYDGEHLTGKVNGLEKRESVNGNIEIRSAEMVIGQCDRYGWFKGFLDDVKIYSCVPSEM